MQGHVTIEEAPRSAVLPSTRDSLSLDPRVIDGRYALERLIASGGAAEVYAARHRFTRRAVALKVPLPGAPPEIHARLRAETEILSRLDHPGIVGLLDAGETAFGPYLALELLEGRTLEALIASRGTIAEQEVLPIGVALAEALHACHAQGVLHRDVKPSNVILGSGGRVTLVDFNVARDSDLAPSSRLTQPGQVVGTLEYMPVEAILGLRSADHRVDIFGLGMTLYECLVGGVPPPLAAPRITAADILSRRPDLSPGTAGLLAACLARDPAERPSTMEEVLRKLREASSPASDAPRSVRELRKSPRAPYRTPVRIARGDGGREDGRVEEISSTGAQLVASRPFAPDTTLRLRFALPNGAITETNALVRWARQGNRVSVVGVEFTDLSESARALIELYVHGAR